MEARDRKNYYLLTIVLLTVLTINYFEEGVQFQITAVDYVRTVREVICRINGRIIDVVVMIEIARWFWPTY
jgi:hypothetical protein